MRRVRISIEGRVQGVGFRPAAYRLARCFGLSGFVQNTNFGVVIEIQGFSGAIDGFVSNLRTASPRQAIIESLVVENLVKVGGEKAFSITASKRSGDVRAGMPPDLAICDLCRQELFDASNRRGRYPFINCTDCGPRFTIISSLPYDRARTTMKKFKMCPDCQAEFTDPLSRRFEAQPNACAVCGPRIRLIDRNFKTIAGEGKKALAGAVDLLKAGKILALKGVGGYHICCDALNEKTVRLLRKRKNRPHKSFAVMFASLSQVRRHCELTAAEEAALTGVAAPIVIVRTKSNSSLQKNISPDTNDIGVFLPYSPLHWLLLAKCGPLVMTSGNRLDEPMVINEEELKTILGPIADAALTHDREILRRCDDSVLKFIHGNFKIVAGGADPGPASSRPATVFGYRRSNLHGSMRIMLRRSRGFVPASIRLPVSGPPILACGAELKNTICVTRLDLAFLSPHVGDLDDFRNYRFFQESVRDFIDLLEIKPEIVAYDMHPDYISTRFALGIDGVKREKIQHHHAHIASCLAEHFLTEKVIGIALDGTGFGPDGTIWGGELLVADLVSFERVGHFKQYPMPGGKAAILNPARMALSILAAEFGADAWKVIQKHLPSLKERERKILTEMIVRKLHSPLTSSAGRLFDAVSALLGFSGETSYEGQAAVRLQALADSSVNKKYTFEIQEEQGILVISFGKTIRAIIADLERRKAVGQIAGMFHNTIAAALSEACHVIREKSGLNIVALSGGVLQNDLLLEKIISCLQKDKFYVYTNQIVPPNDGGISLGQAAVAAARNPER